MGKQPTSSKPATANASSSQAPGAADFSFGLPERKMRFLLAPPRLPASLFASSRYSDLR
jgi:hypothetical protein